MCTRPLLGGEGPGDKATNYPMQLSLCMQTPLAGAVLALGRCCLATVNSWSDIYNQESDTLSSTEVMYNREEEGPKIQ